MSYIAFTNANRLVAALLADFLVSIYIYIQNLVGD